MAEHSGPGQGPQDWVRERIDRYESSDGRQDSTEGGRPTVILTTVDAPTGKLRKTQLLRVEHDGHYAAIADGPGSAQPPHWSRDIGENPLVELQDGPLRSIYRAQEVSGPERERWWERYLAARPAGAAGGGATGAHPAVWVLSPVA